MDDLLAKFGGRANPLTKNEELTGTIIRITKNQVFVDIGRKTEGLIAEKAFKEARDYIKNLKPGEKIHAFVIVPETTEGYTILSLRHAIHDSAWKKLHTHLTDETPVSVVGKMTTGAGMIVEVFGLKGFIPNSLIGRDAQEDLSKLVGQEFKAKIVELSRPDHKIVLSEQAVSEESELKAISEAYKQIEVDKTYTGLISKITDFGLFVRIPVVMGDTEVGIEGLVHISEIAWGKTEDVKSKFTVGREVEVFVIAKEDARGGKTKLSLSIKKTKSDPWEKALKKYEKDSKHGGTVSKISDFGIFVTLEPGVEGLIHVTKIPPNTKLVVGQEVQVYVEEIDSKSRKISLGMILTSKPLGYK